jgi:hypothetical protein
MALQPRMGLLSKRRLRTGSSNRADLAFDRPIVRSRAAVLRDFGSGSVSDLPNGGNVGSHHS